MQKVHIKEQGNQKINPFFLPILFLVGGGGYYLLEILFRGYSHWTMALCGGLCLSLIYLANQRLSNRSLILRAATGAFIITAVEFITGIIVNSCLHWGIWDYSHLPFNLMGQISLAFSLLWFLLCIPVCLGCSALQEVSRRLRKSTVEKQNNKKDRFLSP